MICLLPGERVARCIRAHFGRRSMISLATGSFEMWRAIEEWWREYVLGCPRRPDFRRILRAERSQRRTAIRFSLST